MCRHMSRPKALSSVIIDEPIFLQRIEVRYDATLFTNYVP